MSRAATSTTADSTGSPVKARSRALRATDAISKFLNRRSSDSTTDQVNKPTTPATSEERRFWPRRLTSEKKVLPEAPSGVVHLSTAKEDSVSAATTTVSAPALKPSQPTGSKSDALRRPQHAGSAATAIPAAPPVQPAKPPPGKSRINPSTSSSSPSPHSSLSRQHASSSSASASTAARAPSPPLEAPYTPQYTLRKFGHELTELERHEVLQHGDIFFFSSLEIKSRRRDGKIYSCAALSVSTAAVSDAQPSLHHPLDDSGSGAGSTAATPAPATELFNDGYDDDRGDYLVLAQDHLAFRFEVLHTLGSGSFGQVVCCLDHQTQQQVAVKIIRNRKKYKEQSLIEVQILSQLQRAFANQQQQQHNLRANSSGSKHSTAARVVKMHEYFLFRNHLCISFELLGINLYEYLKLRFFQGLPMANIRDIAAQLVATLRLLGTQRVVHCDLKPENILVKSTHQQSLSARSLLLLSAQNATSAHANLRVEEICLIDFGSSCLETTAVFTYIQSRFYRSPEVILGFPYGTAIDMWSLGCILVELHTGYPIFAGENESEQLACIMELLGVPSHDLLMHSRRRKHFFTENSSAETGGDGGGKPAKSLTFEPKPFVNSRGRKRKPGSRSLTSAIKCDDAQFVEFVRKCLVMDPRQRMTPEQAERDPWLLAAVDGGFASECDEDPVSRTQSISMSQEIIGL